MDLLVPLHIEKWEVHLTKPEPPNKLNQLKLKIMEKEQIKSLKDVKEELLTALKDAMMKYNEMTEFNGGYIQELEEAGLNIYQAIQIVKKNI